VSLEVFMTTHVQNIDDLAALVGTHLGYSNYLLVTQENVNLFAEATGDRQWIHTDPERAKDGPFGGTIAHGYMTLSLIPVQSRSIHESRSGGLGDSRRRHARVGRSRQWRRAGSARRGGRGEGRP
jgi:acyl dehydratase